MSESNIQIDDTSNSRQFEMSNAGHSSTGPQPVTNPAFEVPCPYKVILPVPLLYTNSDPILVIRKDAFGVTNEPFFEPIQFLHGAYKSNGKVKILKENLHLLHELQRNQHRYVSGQVDWSMRVTSNTGIGGNLMIIQADKVIRNQNSFSFSDNYDTVTYDGFDTWQTTSKNSWIHQGFSLNDLSLAKNVIALGNVGSDYMKRDQGWLTQMWRQWWKKPWSKAKYDTFRGEWNQIKEYFTESCIFIYLDSDVTGSPGNITLSFQADYSNVVWETPLYPCIFSPLKTYLNDVVDYTAERYTDFASAKRPTVLQIRED